MNIHRPLTTGKRAVRAGSALFGLLTMAALTGCGKQQPPENPETKANAHVSGEKLEEKQLKQSDAAQPAPGNNP